MDFIIDFFVSLFGGGGSRPAIPRGYRRVAHYPAMHFITDSEAQLEEFTPDLKQKSDIIEARYIPPGNWASADPLTAGLAIMSLLGPEGDIIELGIVAENGTKVTGFTAHGIDRAIGDAAKRAGTKPEAILDALKNPLKIVGGVDQLGRPFQIFTGQNARVVVNPETGLIVSVNPLSGAGAQ